MKSFIIKIGKASSLLKREGVFNGIKILSGYFLLFAKSFLRVRSGDVLIISDGVGDSAHYRAFNQAEELNLHGIKTSVAMQDSPFLMKYADKFKIFIFRRTMMTPPLAKFIEKIKRQNKEIIFETDDLVFDARYIQDTDLYKKKMNAAEKMQYEKGVGAEIIQDEYVKTCVTTTSFLAKILESYGKKVFISKNKICNEELEIANKIVNCCSREKDNFVKIGFFSGTPSHNKDFATIIPAIMKIMEKYSQVRLYLAGPLDTRDKLTSPPESSLRDSGEEKSDKFKDRITILPFVPRKKYYENLWKIDINLAPLVLGDPFCESKSEIRFTGAGILGIPTVAVKNQTFSEAIIDGEDGFLAVFEEEWVEKISRLIENEELRKTMGQKAREKTLRDYTVKNSHNKEYYEYLRSKVMSRTNSE